MTFGMNWPKMEKSERKEALMNRIYQILLSLMEREQDALLAVIIEE